METTTLLITFDKRKIEWGYDIRRRHHICLDRRRWDGTDGTDCHWTYISTTTSDARCCLTRSYISYSSCLSVWWPFTMGGSRKGSSMKHNPSIGIVARSYPTSTSWSSQWIVEVDITARHDNNDNNNNNSIITFEWVSDIILLFPSRANNFLELVWNGLITTATRPSSLPRRDSVCKGVWNWLHRAS